jgi:hypothetical protein
MYCKHCGSSIDETAKYCKNCGHEIESEGSPSVIDLNNINNGDIQSSKSFQPQENLKRSHRAVFDLSLFQSKTISLVTWLFAIFYTFSILSGFPTNDALTSITTNLAGELNAVILPAHIASLNTSFSIQQSLYFVNLMLAIAAIVGLVSYKRLPKILAQEALEQQKVPSKKANNYALALLLSLVTLLVFFVANMVFQIRGVTLLFDAVNELSPTFFDNSGTAILLGEDIGTFAVITYYASIYAAGAFFGIFFFIATLSGLVKANNIKKTVANYSYPKE